MTAPELDEVMTLLGRILPDPAGYGERLIKQAVLQWAKRTELPHPVIPGEADTNGPTTLPDQVLRPNGSVHPPSNKSEVLVPLASALGACDCWGRNKNCPLCAGAGGSGWADPDPDLFQEYVGPAVARLTATWDDTSGYDAHPPSKHHNQLREGAIP